MTSAAPFVSVIVPCREEARHLDACLESIAATEYPRDRLEVLIVVGDSKDGTHKIAEACASGGRIPMYVLPNPAGTAAAGMNIGLMHARGEVIARMDAHATYPREYLPRLIGALQTSGADNVGGVLETWPESDRPIPRAIAAACSHPLGVGNSRFRIGTRANQWVDTVAFGCWRRDAFIWLGTFDEELVRNEDDELNHRLLARGGRILLVADVTARYYARRTLAQVSRMFYQYGFYKPLIARKVGRVMTARQLAPPALTLAFLLVATLAPWLAAARVAGGALAAVYAATVLGVAAALVPSLGPASALVLTTVFPLIHLSYGTGFLLGSLHWSHGKHPRHPTLHSGSAAVPVVPLSR